NYKVIVLDEAHQLTKQAQNALLKHVEDAASSTVWIFCTTEPAKIIPTLRGRCISFALAGLTGEQVKLLVLRGLNFLGWKGKPNELVDVLIREGITSPRAILMAVERFAGGMDPIASIFSSADSPGAFEIAQQVAKRNWLGVRQGLAAARADEAIASRLVVINYLKSMLLKGDGHTFAARAIQDLTAHVPAIEALGLSELSATLYFIC